MTATGTPRTPGVPPTTPAHPAPPTLPGRRTISLLSVVALAIASLSVQVAQTAAAQQARPSAVKRWNHCAEEHQICFTPVTARVTVRYGVGRSWVSRRVTGSVECSNRIFGDPAVGRGKRCEWYGTPVAPPTATTLTSPSAPPTTATPTTTPPAPPTPPTPATTATTATIATTTTAKPADPTTTHASATTHAPQTTTAPTTTAPTTTVHHHGGGMPEVDHSLIPAPNPGYASFRIAPTNDTPRQGVDTGQFRFTCEYSHMNFDDPIVFPGQPGAAHLHVYFGNTGANASTTASSLATTGNSTCAGGTANRTAYWVPAMIDTRSGRPLVPTDILVYYKSDPLPGSRVSAYPAGLRMIAGDMRASSPQNHITWACETATGEVRSTAIPSNCAPGNVVDMGIEFPMCWDGVNLDSPDHRSHMSYAVNDPTSSTGIGCPASHPVQFANITQKIRYRVAPGDDTSAWRLSSDAYDSSLPGGYSAHGDWFNGWDPAVNRTWVEQCLNANRDCHGFLLGDGTTLY